MIHRTLLPSADPTDELIQRAVSLRPDLTAAFDDGWLSVHISAVLLTAGGKAFAKGDIALVRPAVGRHPGDFIAFSERLGALVGLRHGEHFRFADEERGRVA